MLRPPPLNWPQRQAPPWALGDAGAGVRALSHPHITALSPLGPGGGRFSPSNVRFCRRALSSDRGSGGLAGRGQRQAGCGWRGPGYGEGRERRVTLLCSGSWPGAVGGQVGALPRLCQTPLVPSGASGAISPDTSDPAPRGWGPGAGDGPHPSPVRRTRWTGLLGIIRETEPRRRGWGEAPHAHCREMAPGVWSGLGGSPVHTEAPGSSWLSF